MLRDAVHKNSYNRHQTRTNYIKKKTKRSQVDRDMIDYYMTNAALA